jgi:ribonuclease HI
MAQNLVKRLVKKGHKVEVYWCPSYMGIIGNEIADQLAKAGLEKSTKKVYVLLAYLRRQAKALLKEA